MKGEDTSATSLEDVEKAHILRVLSENNYNQSRTASVLGIDRKTLHRKAQRFGIPLTRRESLE